MKYRKIMPKIWYQLESMNSDCKVIAFYCLTSPQVNRIGFYRFSEALACENLGLSTSGFRKAFDSVCQIFDWKFDRQSKMLLIPSWFKFNAPENQSVLKSYIKEFEDLPKNNLTDEFLSVSEQYGIPFPHGVLDGVPHGVPHPNPEPTLNQTGTKPEPNQCSADLVIKIFNSTCSDLPKVKEETVHRKQLIKTRSKKINTPELWKEFFQRVHESNFLNQRIEGKDFKANFNWILKEENFVKILEGNYDNREIKKPSVLPIPDRNLPPEAEAKEKRKEHKLTPEEKATLNTNLKKLGIEKIGKGMI